MAESRKSETTDDVRRPRRKRARLHSHLVPPRPARRIDACAAPLNERADKSLREAEQRFRAIFDNTSDGIFLHDLETREITLCNKSFLQMLGYTEEEFTKLGVADLHPEADLPFIYAQIEEFLRGGKPIRRDIRFQRKDGSILFADVSPDLIRLEGKRYIVVALKDITERKRMEEELRRHAEYLEGLVAARTGELQESERRYRSLAENDPDIVQRFDRDLRRLYVNPAFERATGLSPPAAVGKTDRELGLPDDLVVFWEQAARTVLRTGEHRSIVFEMPTPEGPRHYEAHLVPEFAEDGSVEHLLTITHDITEHQRVEEALRFTQFAVDHTADAAFWMTDDARFFYVNEAACRALGYSREELLQMTVYDIDPAFSESMWRERWDELKAKQNIVFETVHRARDGRIYPVEIRANYVEFGGRAYDCAFARDITERKRAEEALRESEERFRTAFEEGAVPMALTALDSTLLKVNSSFCRMLGFRESDLVGRSFSEITHPDDRAANLVGTRRLACGEISSFRMEKRYVRKDGAVIWADMRTASVHDAQGRPLYCVTHVQDITGRKQAQEALRESEERYRILLENGFDGIFVHENLRIVQLNDRLTEMTGYTRAELMDSNPIDLFLPESQERIRQYIRSGAGGYFEIELRRQDGRIVDIESFGAPCRFQGRSARIVGVRDITERKRAQEVLRRLNEELEVQVAQRTEDLRHTVGRLRELTLELSQAEDRERKRIADILHEDVQQTLAAARFHLNLLAGKTYSAEESRKILWQVRQMLRDAIERSRSLSHELSPAIYQGGLTEILEWLARHMEEKHGLTVRVEAHGPVDSPSEPLKAFLYKVTQELLFNVIKHAAVREARVRVRRMAQCLYLSVVDRGRGFDPQKLEGATGFGLLSIRERVQLLGGRMKIRSLPGRGSRILIAIPDQGTSGVAGPAEPGEGQARRQTPARPKRAGES